MSIKHRSYSLDELLGLVTALIEVSDGDLVNNRKCFPCEKESHHLFMRIRDAIEEMYEKAEFPETKAFQNEVSGRSESFIAMKAKTYTDPVKKTQHKEKLLSKFRTRETVPEALDLVNSEHRDICSMVLFTLEQLSKNYA